MEPVHNREFLLDYINTRNVNVINSNIINSNIINIYNNVNRDELINNIIYMNHLNNNYLYNYGYQAAGAHPVEAVDPLIAAVASASSTFERLNIDVEHHVVASPSQASSSQHCDGDDDACCSICLNSEEEEKDKEKDKEEEEEKMVKTKCAHIFHSKCLAKWVIQKTTCPMCRNSLTKKIT